MSDFTVIRAVSVTLRDLLTTAIISSPDPQLARVGVDLRSPRELADSKVDSRVSLWLHRVWRVSEASGHAEPPPAPQQRSRRGVPLELGYLVTPMHPQAEVRQALLGRVIQVFNDWTTIRGDALRDSLAGSAEQLRVIPHSDLLAEVPALWHSLGLPHQLSLPYLVQRVTLDSERPLFAPVPVLVRREISPGEAVRISPW